MSVKHNSICLGSWVPLGQKLRCLDTVHTSDYVSFVTEQCDLVLVVGNIGHGSQTQSTYTVHWPKAGDQHFICAQEENETASTRREPYQSSHSEFLSAQYQLLVPDCKWYCQNLLKHFQFSILFFILPLLCINLYEYAQLVDFHTYTVSVLTKRYSNTLTVLR